MRHPLLDVRDLTKHYGDSGRFHFGKKTVVRAVDGVSFQVAPGETLALVGESGCGKSSIGRMVLRLTEPTSGSIDFDGRNLLQLGGTALKAERRKLQIVFQDPYGSLNPRKRIRSILAQPLKLAGNASQLGDRISELLALVGLKPAERFIDRLPHEFSGGQRQRIAIARAFATGPKLIVADEPVSALDVSVRAQILTLMRRLQDESGTAYLFITHDLGVVRSIAQRVAVMYLGKIVETGSVEAIFRRPMHPYTEALLSSSPVGNPRLAKSRQRIVLSGDLPSPAAPPPGCRFHTRCPIAQPVCAVEPPATVEIEPGHQTACHLRAPAPTGVAQGASLPEFSGY